MAANAAKKLTQMCIDLYVVWGGLLGVILGLIIGVSIEWFYSGLWVDYELSIDGLWLLYITF